MKRLLTLTTLLLLAIASFAHDFEVDGIYYAITSATDKTVAVSYQGNSSGEYSNEYSGSIVIPETVGYDDVTYAVTSIKEAAFANCTELESISIPNSVVTIGRDAFSGTAWYNNQPDGVVYAGKVVYCYKGSMPQNTSIKLQDGTVSIAYAAFGAQTNLNYIEIPNSVLSIAESAFGGCTGLTSIVLSNSMKAIEKYTFDGCNGLETVTIPEGIEYIDIAAFRGCSRLSSLSIPNSMTFIGPSSFESCSKLSQLDLGSGVTTIAGNAFNGCEQLQTVEFPATLTAIGERAFCGTGLTSVTILNNVTTVDQGAFMNCSSLKTAVLPDNMKDIPNSLFRDCKSLTSVQFPNNVKTIGDQTFYGCTALTTMDIPEGITTIGKNAFSGCKNLASVKIPNTVDEIGNSAFGGCASLTSIALPDGLTVIRDGVFAACTGLTSIEIPSSVTMIGSEAFAGCIGFTEFEIPSQINSFGRAVFSGCTGLTSITLPQGVTNITEEMFGGCTNLSSVTIPNSVQGIGRWAFSGCSSLQSINLPEGVKSISDGAFMYSGLKSINLPNSLTYIGENAFSQCSNLLQITIPKSVSWIGYNVFVGCPSLETIYCNIVSPTSSTRAGFDQSVYKDAALYVPNGTREKYLALDGWKNFVRIRDVEPSTDNVLALSNCETYAGKQIVLPIEMNNTANITAFQFDLYLPDGVTIAKDEDNEYIIDLSDRATKSHSISFSQQADGAMRLICTSMSSTAFKGNSGSIVNITLDVAPEMSKGDYIIKVRDIELSDGTPYNPLDIKATLTVKTYSPGDTDGNGKVTVNDAVCIINYILGTPGEGFVEEAADLDGNGEITVNDVVILINDFILGGNSQNSLYLNLEQVATADEDYLYINDINMKAGETREVEVYMNTARTDIQGLQCDIYLPEGIEFVYEEDGGERYYAEAGGRAARSHSVAAKVQADGALRVVETSTSGAKFKDNDQAVFVFQIKAKDDMPAGNAEIKLGNMELSYGGAPINPSDRTSVIVIDGTPTGVDAIEANEASSSFVGKFIKDNQIIIMKSGKKYSVCGQEK